MTNTTATTTTTTTTAVAGPGPGPPQAYPGQLPPLGHCDQPSTKSKFPLKGRVLKSCHSAWEPDNLIAEKCQSRFKSFIRQADARLDILTGLRPIK